ncbi:MAG: DUF2156 domain-containing protein [Lachnospiraceae bacterium]|nr:DUF2156 domain-containing protein [Lachnospiraceae bacterium]
MDINELKDLSIEDFDTINKYYNMRRMDAADGNVLDLFLWNDCYPSKILTTDKGLMVIGKDDDSYYSMIPFCKKEDLKDCFDYLKHYFNNVLNQKLELCVVDRQAIEILGLSEDEFIIEEDRDLFDYVYDAKKLHSYPGRKFHKKKNHLNVFRREYKNRYEFKYLNYENIDEISQFLTKWKDNKEKSDMDKYIDFEISGIKKVLKWQDIIDFKIGGLYIDGCLEAFTIGKYYKEEGMVYIPVEKANSDFKGIYAYICSKFLREAFPEASKVNREDDMGIEGLRRSKMSLNPIYLVEKYNVTQK